MGGKIWHKENFCSFLAPIKSQNDRDSLELVWKDIVPRGSSRRSLIFFVPYFPTHLDFLSPPLSASGYLRMGGKGFFRSANSLQIENMFLANGLPSISSS